MWLSKSDHQVNLVSHVFQINSSWHTTDFLYYCSKDDFAPRNGFAMLAKHSRATDVHLAPVLSHLATDCESKPQNFSRSHPKNYWLVVSTPLKIWKSVGWLFPIYGKIIQMFQTSKPPTRLLYCRLSWDVNICGFRFFNHEVWTNIVRFPTNR